MRSFDRRAALDAPPSAMALSKARVEYRRRHGDPRPGAGSLATVMTEADDLMAEAMAERSTAMRWVLLDEARKRGVAAGSAVVIGRAVRLLGAEFEIDELSLEYRSLREIPLRGVRGHRAAEIARSADALATTAEIDGRIGVAVDSLALSVRAWQAAGSPGDARSAAERHDSLLARARAEGESPGSGRTRAERPPAEREPAPRADPFSGTADRANH